LEGMRRIVISQYFDKTLSIHTRNFSRAKAN
jgi:hypothetical protein